MAHLPAPDQEPTLRPPGPVSLALCLALCSPSFASAQQESDVRPLIEIGSGLTSVGDETTILVDFALALTLSPSFTVGGAGHLVPSSVALGQVGFREVELDLGYGGIFGRVERPAPFPRSAWYGELLLGAGNGDVRDPATGLGLDSDNFFVVQPALGLTYGIAGPLRASTHVALRMVTGVEDLRGVRTADLRSLSLHVRLRFTPL